MKSILITGIAGSGASYLADYITTEYPDVKVHGVARWHSITSEDNLQNCRHLIKLYECDLLDFSSTLYVLNLVKPDVIFHMASFANVRASFQTPIAVINNNIMSTVNLLEAVRSADISPRIMICSTSEVYGQVSEEDIPIKEECALKPSSPYALSKVAQDLLGYSYYKSYNMDIVRTRMFAYLNPRRSDLFATSFAMQIARIERRLQQELVHGNLDSVRTIIDVRDAMRAYCDAVLYCKAGEAYNIGGTTSIKVGEFLDILISLAKGCPIKTRLDPRLLRPSDVTLQIPNTSKFQNATGYKPRYTFKESVEHLLEHCRSVADKETMS